VHTVDTFNDGEDWAEVAEGFRVIGFDENERDAVMQLVAAILHMGNLKFEVSFAVCVEGPEMSHGV
jgi:myosin heavy subunit